MKNKNGEEVEVTYGETKYAVGYEGNGSIHIVDLDPKLDGFDKGHFPITVQYKMDDIYAYLRKVSE